jgi:plastocyanin
MHSIGWRAGAAIIAVAALSACGGGGGGSSSTAPSTVPSGAVTITINGQNGVQSFTPNPASAGGQMVVFKNSDSVTHRVVLNDGSIDTGDIAPGATSKAVQMPSDGTNYHCSLHAGMVGAVAGASGDAPTCDGPYCDGTYY